MLDFAASPLPVLNPYEQFKQLKPDAMIDYGVFIYNGHFDIPLAAALSDGQKANVLLTQNKTAEALAEAQKAETLAPGSARINATMGRILDANGRPQEALPYYEKALTLAQTVEPQFQQSLIKALKQLLAAQRP
jgi:tetratricopeptide (TPR) repeat protein